MTGRDRDAELGSAVTSLKGAALALVAVLAVGCGSPATSQPEPSPRPARSAASTAKPSPDPSKPATSTAKPSPSLNPSLSHVCMTSAVMGNCGPYSVSNKVTGSNGYNTYVGQNVWNPIAGWQQTLYATDPGNFTVIANMPAGNTAVVSYPSAYQLYDVPLSSLASIYSSFSETMNTRNGTSAEAAYDLWFHGPEVMIQVDTVNRGSCDWKATKVHFGGSAGVPVQEWNFCDYNGELIWQLVGNEQSGTVDVLAMLKWLMNKGYLAKDARMSMMGFGWEICSTGGVSESFHVSNFSITLTGSDGSTGPLSP